MPRVHTKEGLEAALIVLQGKRRTEQQIYQDMKEITNKIEKLLEDNYNKLLPR